MSSSSTQVQEEETTTTHPPSVEVLPEVLVDKLTGTVKWFNNRSGYGFITVCDGEHVGKDIFVHYKSINVKNSQYKYLVQGEYVDFTLVKSSNDKHEYQAINISGVKGGPILCETRKLMQHSEVPHPPQVYNTGRHPRRHPPPQNQQHQKRPPQYLEQDGGGGGRDNEFIQVVRRNHRNRSSQPPPQPPQRV